MAKKLDLLIGIPTYNDFERIERLLESIKNVTDFEGIKHGIVILDDGTSDPFITESLVHIAKEYQADIIIHAKNEGIPQSWNDLATHRDAEYVVLFNDDIKVTDPNWAKCLIYFLKNNENVGSAGFPLVQMDPRTNQPHPERNSGHVSEVPGRCGAPVGCSFGFSRKYFDEVGGFWSELVSFHEESQYGFVGASKGFFSYMLPYPTVEHWGSRTFAGNSELSVRQIDDSELPKEEYLKIVTPYIEKWPHLVYFYRKEGKNFIRDDENGDYVGRMDYSRAMFAKKWGVEEYYDNPMQPLHERYIDTAPKRHIKFFDKDLNEREELI